MILQVIVINFRAHIQTHQKGTEKEQVEEIIAKKWAPYQVSYWYITVLNAVSHHIILYKIYPFSSLRLWQKISIFIGCIHIAKQWK